ncbi:MAG TPA: DUF1269 domain-containing protein [Acidimicrobiia bacterium]|jgi:uncharacterized membrane protein|nr:DUF1269 domain-containing protein [Acidimicrobiia bacterium]
MTDERTSTPATDTEPTDPEAIIGLVTDGAHSLIVAQFPTMEDAEAAYQTLRDVERDSALKIDGVVVASCDAEGKVHLGEVTDHSTKTGLKWGVVGGAIIGVIFPPSIIASAAALGAAGAVLGKTRNVFNRKGLADELADVMQPNTSGIIALVEDTAVVEIRKALDKADRIVEKAIDEQIAAEIDREAAAAKGSLASGD